MALDYESFQQSILEILSESPVPLDTITIVNQLQEKYHNWLGIKSEHVDSILYTELDKGRVEINDQLGWSLGITADEQEEASQVSADASDNPPESPSITSDGPSIQPAQISTSFVAGSTEEGLENLRQRLLDLTLRNRLLNFRHTKRSSLRVIDELPDQLYHELIDGKTFRFIPIVEPTRHECIRYYQEQNISWRNQKPTEEEWATHKGTSTSFELSSSPVDIQAPQHTDTKIQTLLYPKDLEATLRKISGAARTAIEESGTNMLYLGVGFLEWKESDQATNKPLAPLILLPATLERGAVSKQTGTYTYKLSYSGEDISTNISLREKLYQDFGIELPEVEEDELPEAYFGRVEEEIEGKSEWCVRRYVTLSLFQFGKQLMYLDLDPLEWPGQNILEHSIIRSFFEGGSGDGPDHVVDYNLDDNPKLVDQTPIIREADSSQHSALIDALQGRNLVIEGPPGTGKSQTITNLIAAALDQGKTILFVSEKLAALEVVHRRLKDSGLGNFCLELHSHKAQKKNFISDIKVRLERMGGYLSPRDIQSKMTMLERDKERLKQHAELMAQEFGRLGLTIYDIFCAAARYRLDLSHQIAALGDGPFSDPLQVEPIEVVESEGALTAYQAAYEEIIQQCQRPSAHPWHGVRNTDLQPFDRNKVDELLTAWKSESERIVSELIEFEDRTGITLETKGCNAQTYSNLAEAIPKPRQEVWVHIIPQLDIPDPINHLGQFAEALSSFQRLEEIASIVLQDYRIVQGELRTALKRAHEEAIKLVEPQVRINQLIDHKEAMNHLIDLVESITPTLSQLAHHLGAPIHLNEEGIKQIRTAIQICQQAPNRLLHLRNDLFDNDEIDQILLSVESKTLSLNEQTASLKGTYNLSVLPDAQVLHQAQQTMITGGLFRWFKADWREANRLLKSLSLSNVKGSPETKAQSLVILAQYKEYYENFEQNEQAHRLLGPLFTGIDTNIADLRLLREWYSAVRSDFGYSLSAQGISSDSILQLSESLIQAIAQLGEVEFSEHLSEIDVLHTRLRTLIPTLGQGHLEGPESILPNLAQTLDHTLGVFEQAGIKVDRTLHQLTQAFTYLTQLDELESSINENRSAQSILGDEFKSIGSDYIKISEILLLAQEIHDSSLSKDLKVFLFSNGNTSSFELLRSGIAHLATTMAEMEQKRHAFTEFTDLDSKAWFGASNATIDVDLMIQRADTALDDLMVLAQWTTYIRTRGRLAPKKLLTFAQLVEEGTLPPAQLIPAFRCTVYNDMARAILQHHPSLREFNRHDQNTIRDRFCQYDEDILVLQQQKIASKIDERKVPSGNDRGTASSRTELALLEHETNKQTRHIPIRQLIKRSSEALQALKPCFMMGPLSVAQYLEPGNITFDLVIMDEASQVRPEDALGTIARGKQAVIVGDPRQLPPTRFFDRMFGDDEEDEDSTVLQDAESILDAAATVFKPARRLLWHYRSRHEKLIAFSNHYFYSDNPLIVFPSPHPGDPRFGVQLTPIHDGVFSSHRNVPEAKKIAQAVIHHMRNHRDESLGVVAMNNHQSELISEEVDNLLKKDPRAQAYVESYDANSEPFFVKNLENVQGDERDVIFISFTYGPSSDGGQVFQRFGPINSQVGWRRLNVLFTRAKNRVVAFSSMSSSDVRGGPDVSEGTRALKNYLAYAETGILEQARETGRPPDSDFEVSVAHALQKAGYECVAQVGMAGFFIDLAVMHPDLPGKYLLGIECDGATYHSARSVRDRDRLRQAILENLGWTIHRIWSTDWFKDPESEIQRVLATLSQLRENEQHQTYIEKEFAAPLSTPTDTTVDKAVDEQLEINEREDEEENIANGRFITAEQARGMLIDLRDNTIRPAFPDSDLTEGFLRKAMLDALLSRRPKNMEEFRREIPLKLRDKLDTNQFSQFHLEVFDILSQIVDPTSKDMFTN
jgi:very-short-patch-repair endonuclease